MTDFTKVDLDVLIPDMEAQRKRIGLSYQGVADACEVSQATIIRLFKRQSSPSFELLQKVASAIKYEPHFEAVLPTDCNVEAYNDYLQRSLAQQKGDYERQLLQQEAQFNRIHAQDHRLIKILCLILGVFSVVFVAFRAIDMQITNRAAEAAVELCDSCGSEIVEHSQFCAWCGYEQGTEEV